MSLLLRTDRTHKLYQRVHVIDQGKSCGDGDNCKKRGFAPEVVARFVFEIIAGDVPKWSHTDRCIMRARILEPARVIAVICER